MANVSIYLNFLGKAEEAFNTYKKIFKTDFSAQMMRMRDIPAQPGMPELSEADKNKVMHVALPIIGGTEIMGTDVLESMGHKLIEGNNVTISLNLDQNAEADRLYRELSQGGADGVAPHEEFWGYWGTCKDRFGIRWMFNVMKPNQN
ncbi:MAG TPA: VOC family protein [Bacteroidia bacterium]|nr:VOC family protein [Bacteroidia bacterium]